MPDKQNFSYGPANVQIITLFINYTICLFVHKKNVSYFFTVIYTRLNKGNETFSDAMFTEAQLECASLCSVICQMEECRPNITCGDCYYALL